MQNADLGGANLQRDVDARVTCHFYLKSLANVFLEARYGHCEIVCTGGQLGNGVIARSRARSLVHRARGRILSFNRSAGDYGSRRIRNSAGNVAAIGLSKRGRNEDK